MASPSAAEFPAQIPASAEQLAGLALSPPEADAPPASETSEAPETDPQVVEALQAIAKRDTLDVYGRRLRGTTALGTRAVASGVAASVYGVLRTTAYSTSVAIGSATAIVSASLISTGVYVGHRLTESRRAGKAELHQQVVRDALGEPVDVIRQKGRGHRLAMRWYGADKDFGGHDDPQVVARFKKVVDFAEAHGVDEVVASTSLLRHAAPPAPTPVKSEKAAEPATLPPPPPPLTVPRTTTTRQLFKDTKAVLIDDRNADATLARLTVPEAKELLSKLESDNLVAEIDALANWLARQGSSNPEMPHPITPAYEEWKRLGRPTKLMPKLISIMKEGVARHFASNTAPDAIRYERAYVFRTEATVIVNPHGIRMIITPRVRLPDNLNQCEDLPFERIVGMPMDDFATQLLKQVNRRDIDGGAVLPSERWKIELALYHVLNRGKDADRLVSDKSTTHGAPTDAAQTKTLYERMTDERPRTKPVRPGLPSRGAVSKAAQTIEYGRLFWRNMTKKTGAAVLALAMGGGLGAGSGMAWNYVETANTYRCNAVDHPERYTSFPSDPTPGKDKTPYVPPPEDIAFCHGALHRWQTRAGKPAEYVFSAEDSWEKQLIIAGFRSGLFSHAQAQELMSYVDSQWALQKTQDLRSRYNLYGDGSSEIGDVQPSGNPALYNLTPLNGASTAGLWPQSTQTDIFVDTRVSDKSQLPPYRNLMVKLDPSYDGFLIAPFGTELSPEQTDVDLVRELHIPAQPADMTKPLIAVNTRRLKEAGQQVRWGTTVGDARTLFSYEVPVIDGGDVVGATVVVRDIANDKEIAVPKPVVYQQQDGTFRLAVPDMPNGYVDITYWVDPNAATALPVRARHPMTAGQPGEDTRLLTEVVQSADVANLLKSLNLPPNATAGQVFEAIKHTHTYSYTPYTDTHAVATQTARGDNNTLKPTNELLRVLAEYATAMPSENCNLTFMIGAVASRGQNGDEFINGVTGFNNNGDTVLSQIESHQWAVTNKPLSEHKADFLDGTPGGGTTDPPPVEPYKNPLDQDKGVDTTLLVGQMILSLLSMGAGMAAGRKLTPATVHVVRSGHHSWARRRRDSAEAWLDQQDDLVGDVGMLKQLLYAPAGTPLDDRQPPRLTAGQRTAKEQLQGLPRLTDKDVQALIVERQADGHVHLSDDTVRRLRDVVSRANRAARPLPKV